ncbi:MAG TPA: hypothetical protein PKA66_05765 [Gemmatimonadales bacterium]|nr:hypothetical protein [Gemmatimonadales bacterium]
MPVTTVGPIVVAAAVWCFGFMLFRGMVFEWHRRDAESRESTR